jgi:hypothetical protein
MKKLISILIISFVLASGVFAQSANCSMPVDISGYITKANGTPIPYGHVVIFNKIAAKITTANSSGFYQIQGCVGNAYITGIYDNFLYTTEKYTFTPRWYRVDMDGPFIRSMNVVANQ